MRVQQKLALLVQLNVLNAQEEIIISVQPALRDFIFSLLLMIRLVRRHVLVDTIKTLELIHVTLVRLSVRHVQDRTAINVKAVHLDIMRVQQKLALLVQLNVLLAQEEIIISAQLVLQGIISSPLLPKQLVPRHVRAHTIQTLELMSVILAQRDVQHVQDRPIQNVQPALLDITTVHQKPVLLVQLNVLNAQKEIIINVQLVLRDIIFSLLLMILLVRLPVLVDIIQIL